MMWAGPICSVDSGNPGADSIFSRGWGLTFQAHRETSSRLVEREDSVVRAGGDQGRRVFLIRAVSAAVSMRSFTLVNACCVKCG